MGATSIAIAIIAGSWLIADGIEKGLKAIAKCLDDSDDEAQNIHDP
jgi:hypothetical protein